VVKSRVFRISSILVLASLLAACTESIEGGPASLPNRAGVDMATTKAVLDMVRDDLKTVFPMVAKTTADKRPDLVRQRLAGRGESDVEDVMHDKLNHTVVDRVTVVDTAVVRLIGEHAEVLVLGSLDEGISDGEAHFVQGVSLLLGLDRRDGLWRISRVDQDPQADPAATAMAKNQRSQASDALTTERDAAVSAAITLATQLTEFDSADPKGSYDKWLQVSVEPLTTKLRTQRAQLDESGFDTTTVAPNPIVAPIYVRPGDATLLVLLHSFRSQGSGASDPLRVQVVRTADGSWRAADFTAVDTIGRGHP
jgi:hypothetical protein